MVSKIQERFSPKVIDSVLKRELLNLECDWMRCMISVFEFTI
jgi:hypothetical protein